MVVLSPEIYNAIVEDFNNYEGLRYHCEKFLIEKYPYIPQTTIGSILGTLITDRMKRKCSGFKNSQQCYTNYLQCKNNGESNIMMKLSNKYNVTPGILARYILNHVYDDQNAVKKMKNDSTLIPDRHLAYEVFVCNLYDSDNGFIGNEIKRSIGQEYEMRLAFELDKLKISYEDENVLRDSGYDKTPDIKLTLPIAVDGFVINWIESKALFGDAKSHDFYLKQQLKCYWNRFGPGMVIYWFGYIDLLEQTPENNKFIILSDGFPSKDRITLMNPDLIDP